MPAGISDRTDYQISTVESWPAPQKTRIIAFISSSENAGRELLSGVAAAISARAERARVLIFDSESLAGDETEAENTGSLQAARGIADYLLVDLPFRPTSFARSVLAASDLVLVASSCKFDFLSEAEDIVKVLLFLGIAAEKVAGVVVDPDGILSSASLADIKPYLEANLGIEMAGVVSFGADAGDELDRDIEQLVRYIN
jgi:hypothetical protein